MCRNLINDTDFTVRSEKRMDYSMKGAGKNGYPYKKQERWPNKTNSNCTNN